MESLYKGVFALSFAGLVASLRPVARRLRERPGGSLNQMANEIPVLRVVRPALGLVFYLALLDWLLPGSRLEWTRLDVPTAGRWLGAAGCLGAVGTIQLSLEALGTHYRGGVGLWDDHELVVTGPYALVRHPIYSAFILLTLSLWALSANWLLGGAGVLLTVSIPVLRLRIEERELSERFGQEHAQYAEATPRFVPWLF